MSVFVKRVCRSEALSPHKKLPLHIGILGEAGVGKSTLLAAIARLGERKIEAQRDSGWLFSTGDSQHPLSASSYTAVWRHSVGAVVKWETNRSTCLLHDLPATSDANAPWLRTDLAYLSAAILVLDAQIGFTAATHDLLRLAHQMGVPLVVPFLNKCDSTPGLAAIDAVDEAIEDELTSAGFCAVTPIWGAACPALIDPSSSWGETIEQLLLHLDHHLALESTTTDCFG
jgi:elongation factor Tu